MRILIAIIALLVAMPARSNEPDIDAIVKNQILPAYQTLAKASEHLSRTASEYCLPGDVDLIAAYHSAFDAWVAVSHLRFGPSEEDDRAFALAFWPDPRGATQKTIGALLQEANPETLQSEVFAKRSVAARGFYAFEYLVFDQNDEGQDEAGFRCALIQAVSQQISHNASAILEGWQSGYSDLMTNPGNDTYRTSTEVSQQLFTALTTGLEFTSQTRLGRPMGSFDKPRPKRAEAWRSKRSLRHVILSLHATRELAASISMHDAEIEAAFELALKKVESLDDPIFSGVADPQQRFKVEVLQQSIDVIRQRLLEQVGPRLGISAGFNSLDGD